jgi:parallel beta-helix repeat protein
MIRLDIMLNNRRRFVFSVATAAVFVLLAGGANAVANTVWTVSKTSPNPTCSPATTCNNITSAVNAASKGDVIVVGPGSYNETVFISKSNLYLLGERAGRDARIDRHDQTKESIVDASGTPTGSGGGAAFYVNAHNVVIDGFTIQGGGVTAGTPGPNASGIYVTPSGNASQILNNIIQNNAMGLYFAFSSPYNSYFVLVKHNLFKTNNAGTSGSSTYPIPGQAGFGIVGDTPADGTDITENKFIGNKATAILLAGRNINLTCSNVEITENTSYEDGSFVILGYCYNVIFSHNIGEKFGAQGFLSLFASQNATAAVEAVINNQALQINDNDLGEGRVSGYSGIDFVGQGANYACFQCQVSNNRITRFAGNGIVAESASCASTLQWSGISGNHVEDNGEDGILIGATPCASPPPPHNQFNEFISLVDNEVEGNHGIDCEDDTAGGGYTPILTLGTANTWVNNIGTTSFPAGQPPLCTPGRAHDHD